MIENIVIQHKICDLCNKKDIEGIQSLVVDYGRYCDGAGDMDDKTLYTDLCPACMASIITHTFDIRKNYTLADLIEVAHTKHN